MTGARARRRALLAVAVIGLLPVLSVLIAGGVATAADCILHEGFANPCVILGIDFGELLYSMGVMGWLGLISVPAALLAIGLLVLDLLITAILRIFGR